MPVEAVTVTGVVVLTAPAVSEKVWTLVFAGKFRVAGTGKMDGTVLTRFTVSPPAGALAFRVTVPVTI